MYKPWFEQGCVPESNQLVMKAINSTLDTVGKQLSFNQFAFAKLGFKIQLLLKLKFQILENNSQSENFVFNLECHLKIGTYDSCNKTRRSIEDGESKSVNFGLRIKPSGFIERHQNGIITTAKALPSSQIKLVLQKLFLLLTIGINFIA